MSIDNKLTQLTSIRSTMRTALSSQDVEGVSTHNYKNFAADILSIHNEEEYDLQELIGYEPFLTFSSPTTFTLSVANPQWDGTMEYACGNNNFATWDGSSISSILVGSEYIIKLRGSNNTRVSCSSDGETYSQIAISGSNVSCNGNIETLLDYQEVDNGTHPSIEGRCFAYCFENQDALISSPLLPSIDLRHRCYYYMFNGCTSLTVAPKLPATTLAIHCYNSMFRNCTSLKVIPELSATTLANYCYYYMFYGCTSLKVIPELPATTLTNSCYGYMFQNCTSLVIMPQLPATTLTVQCYNQMFSGCTSLSIITNLSATTLAESCYYNMFRGCTALKSIINLPATVLANTCYYRMFIGCSNIKISAIQNDEYKYPWIITNTESEITATNWNHQMIYNTGGTFKDNPSINTTYYTNNLPV